MQNKFNTMTTNSTLRATIERVPSVLNRHSSKFVARLSDTGWQATGLKDGLIDALRESLTRQCEYMHTRKYVRIDAKRVTFALYYANGWQYDIIHDETPENTGTSMLSTARYTEALERMLEHVAQYRAD